MSGKQLIQLAGEGDARKNRYIISTRSTQLASEHQTRSRCNIDPPVHNEPADTKNQLILSAHTSE